MVGKAFMGNIFAHKGTGGIGEGIRGQGYYMWAGCEPSSAVQPGSSTDA